jgi:hypothetical protein
LSKHVDLDEIFLKVHSPKTKELLSEVYNCYGAGSYRSALVTLWTVLISDLFFKLEELSEIYEDAEAGRLISEIETYWKDKPTSSEWEFDLVKRLKEKYEFIPDTLFVQIQHLKDLRNICAHPTFKKGYELFHPNAELCKGAIRTFVEELFAHSPMFHSEISEKLLLDIEENKNIFAKLETLEKYLEDKYLSKSTDYVLTKLFRTLWKLVFRTEDERCNENRGINYKALKILVRKKPVMLLREIEKESDYYNNISSNSDLVLFFAAFLSDFPDFIGKVREANLLLARDSAKNSEKLILKSAPLFESEADWENVCLEKLMSREWEFQLLIPEFLRDCTPQIRENFINRAITRYGSSGSFSSADSNFTAVEYALEYFTMEHVKKFIEETCDNNQTYGRGRAGTDHRKFVNFVRENLMDDDPNLLDDFPKIERFPVPVEEEDDSARQPL